MGCPAFTIAGDSTAVKYFSMPDYKTPGVYIEEIPQFPSSVVAVETAVPAFIGYTEKGDWKQPGDLLKKPFRIQSLLEYEQYFGKPAPERESLSVVFALSGPQLSITGYWSIASA